MKKLLQGSDKIIMAAREALLPERSAQNVLQNRRQTRQQVEELKMQVLDLAERHMEISMRILKRWIADNPK